MDSRQVAGREAGLGLKREPRIGDRHPTENRKGIARESREKHEWGEEERLPRFAMSASQAAFPCSSSIRVIRGQPIAGSLQPNNPNRFLANRCERVPSEGLRIQSETYPSRMARRVRSARLVTWSFDIRCMRWVSTVFGLSSRLKAISLVL